MLVSNILFYLNSHCLVLEIAVLRAFGCHRVFLILNCFVMYPSVFVSNICRKDVYVSREKIKSSPKKRHALLKALPPEKVSLQTFSSKFQRG